MIVKNHLSRWFFYALYFADSTVRIILEKEVRRKPAPKGYFLEFGDSSLNFRLLAWVNLDNRLEVESEINVKINKKLAEAGIEIPFPQRDLHIRSDDTKTKK